MNQALVDVVEGIRQEIIAQYDALGLRASGKFERELRVMEEPNRIRIMAPAHTWYMVNGRVPGKRPPREVILQWIRDKGIQPSGISEQSLAYLISRKIGQQGITVPNRYNAGTLLEALNEQAKQRIEEAIESELSYIMINTLKQ